MAFTGVHFILIIIGLDLIEAKTFLVETVGKTEGKRENVDSKVETNKENLNGDYKMETNEEASSSRDYKKVKI